MLHVIKQTHDFCVLVMKTHRALLQSNTDLRTEIKAKHLKILDPKYKLVIKVELKSFPADLEAALIVNTAI